MSQKLSNLPVGAKIKYGKYQVNTETPLPIMWTIVAKNHRSTPDYPTNAITLITSNVIDFRCFDAKEPNNPIEGRASHGNNNYRLSNIHQWMNSADSAGAWFSKTHDYDQSPDSNDVVLGWATYANRPGFLYHFSNDERDAIQETRFRVVMPDSDPPATYEDISAKVFLASRTEVGMGNEEGFPDGSNWGYFTTDAGRKATITQQLVDNHTSYYTGLNTLSGQAWWLRTPKVSTSTSPREINGAGTWYDSTEAIASASNGFRPVINLSSEMEVSDSTDSEGCYTIVWNHAPSAPSSLNIPTAILGGKSANISWGASSDSDGNLIGYILERSYNGGEFVQIYKGTSRSFVDNIAYGNTSVQYRVCAYDDRDETGSYTTAASRTILNNKAPVISGSDTNLGVKTEGFSQSYTVTDAEGGAVTVTEAIDGVAVRSYAVTLGANQTFAVTGETWLKVGNGSHAMTITATDEHGDFVIRTYTFEKSVYSFTVQNTTPYESSTKPVRIKLFVSRSIPEGADFKVYVCNNGFDSSPTWEDATSSVLQSSAHVFTNESKNAGNWGVSVKVVVARNNAVGACYVTQIGGNFE